MSDDCPCRAIPAAGDAKGASISGLGSGTAEAPSKPKRKKQLRGAHCVVSKKSGKAFNCSDSEEKAHRLARALGDRFEVRSSRGRSRE